MDYPHVSALGSEEDEVVFMADLDSLHDRYREFDRKVARFREWFEFLTCWCPRVGSRRSRLAYRRRVG